MSTQYDTARERHAIETLRSQRVEGLILTVADAHAHPLLDALDADGQLYVLMHNDTPHRPSVAVDNRLAAYDGVSRLIARGHRRVLMLAGSLSASDRAKQRHLGCRRSPITAWRRCRCSKSISTRRCCPTRCSRS